MTADPEHVERRFRHIYEHSPVAMHSIDEQAHICDVNRAWLAMTGYRREDVIGQPASFLMTEESARRAVEEVIPRFWRDGSVRAVPYEYVRADGSLIEVELDCDATVNPDGKRISLSVVRDVTEHNRTRRALEQREAELRVVLERSPDAIVLHRDARVVWANARAAALLDDGGAADLTGRPVPAALTGEDEGDEREDALHETCLTAADGSERVLEVARMTVHFDGDDTGLVVARDLTERRMLQATLTQADRLATVGTLAAGVAHEVNNPLTYVIHFVEQLRKDLDKLASEADGIEGAHALAERMRDLESGAALASEGCGRVRDIIRDLKTFGRVEDGAAVPIDLNRAVESAVQLASHHVRRRAQLDLRLGALPAVRANDGRMCQVFLNLLMNAAQAIEGGGTIALRTWSAGGWVHASVSDTGSGIEERHLARLFEPFFTTKPRPHGSGLGLWISRQIVREVGGDIEVDSEPGRGSTFTVVLPVVRGAQAAVPVSDPPPRALTPRLPSRRFLVVDDEPALRELLAEALAERAQVVTAPSGDEARELIEHDDRFDLVLCDLMMPGMNGLELYDWVREHRPSLARRFVFMSGAAYTPEAREFLRVVRNERIDKPFRVRDLELVLDRVLGPTVRIHA